MDAFIQPETLDENNQYFCAKCNKMCKAHKGLKFASFPYILSLQLKRFDFDYTTMSRIKLSNRVTFPEVLNVRKYLESERTSQQQHNTEINEPIDKIIKIDEDESKEDNELFNYELFSIMIHSGSATGGHYYAYIKCFETNQWYNFNDERVSKLDRQDISKAFGTSYSMYSSTTAYMLLYRQINQKRNQKFIKADEFGENLRLLLDREQRQLKEAEALKEFMDNVCKVKVIVPTSGDWQDGEISPEPKRKEKTINIHKDLTLDKAKLEIIKVCHLNKHLQSFFLHPEIQCLILKIFY